jgi:Family of unknown function (DUF5677)
MSSLSEKQAPSVPVVFGYAEEWRAFGTRHPEFLRRFPNIEKAIDTAFQRTWHSTELLDRVLYFLGRLVVEEFMEVLLLCANGYGIGAQKLVRGMYERAVTARYLRDHPDEVDNYLAFHKVVDHKLLKAVQSSIGRDVFSKAHAEEIERDFEEVKQRFMVPDCETCKTSRLNHTWSRRDLVSMARMSGDLGKLIVPAYYLPTREAHSTIGAIFSRLDAEAAEREDELIFDSAAQRDHADEALITAHNIMLNILDLQKEYFHLRELEPLLQTCFEDFMVIWRKEDKEARPPQTSLADSR